MPEYMIELYICVEQSQKNRFNFIVFLVLYQGKIMINEKDGEVKWGNTLEGYQPWNVCLYMAAGKGEVGSGCIYCGLLQNLIDSI